jgi:hypothetical protein
LINNLVADFKGVKIASQAALRGRWMWLAHEFKSEIDAGDLATVLPVERAGSKRRLHLDADISWRLTVQLSLPSSMGVSQGDEGPVHRHWRRRRRRRCRIFSLLNSRSRNG